MEKVPNVIAFGYAKRALVPGSREYERMREYAATLGSYCLIVFTRKEEGYPTVQTDGTLTLYATNATSKVGMIFAAYSIAAKIIKTNPGSNFVVSGQDPFAASIVPWFLSFKKRVALHVQVHGDVFNPYFFERDRTAFLKRFFAKLVLVRATLVRVVSNRIKDSLTVRGIAARKIIVLPIQSDMDAFLKVGHARTTVVKNTVDFLYVGRFAPEKDVELLLRAFALMVRERPECRLTLTGAGPMERVYKDYITRLGLKETVSILPWQDNIAELMGYMDVFCLASKHEGYAMVLLEALAAGLPVVTTDVGCVGEVVIDGEVGLVVRGHSAAAYAAALTTIATDTALRTRLKERTVAVAEKQMLTKDAYLQAIKHSYLT